MGVTNAETDAAKYGISSQVKPRRIVFVDLFFSWPPRGGASVDTFHVAKEAQRRGHSVLVIAASHEGREPLGQLRERVPFPVAIVSGSDRQNDPYQFATAIQNRVQRYAPDFVFVAESWVLSAFLIQALDEFQVFSRLFAYEPLCPLNGTRFVNHTRCEHHLLTDHEECSACVRKRFNSQYGQIAWEHDFFDVGAKDYQKVRAESFRKADALIVSNHQLARELKYLNGRILVVSGGVDTDKFKPAAHMERRAGRRLLMVGRADDPAKGFSVLKQAIDRLRWRGMEISLLVTGNATVQDEAVSSVGWVPYEDMPALYQHADVVVVPSIWEEPFGLVAVEALASGVPVVASDHGGLTEIVTEDVGRLVRPGSVNELADALAELTGDKQLRKRMAGAARSRADERYSWSVVFDRHYQCLLV